jgi:succinylarginine dihydrolase
MANGGGPACLRLRVVCDPNTVDQRFIADHDKLNMIAEIITEYWPESIAPDQLSDPALISQVQTARSQLLTACSLTELE